MPEMLEMLKQTTELLKKVQERMKAAGFRAEFGSNTTLVIWIGSNITNDQSKFSLDLNPQKTRIEWHIGLSGLSPTGVFFNTETNAFMCEEPGKIPEDRLIELAKEQDKNLRGA